MDPDLGWVDLGVRPRVDDGFGSTLDRQIGPGLDQAGRSAGSRFSAGFKRAALVGAGGLAAAATGALKLSLDSIDAASNLEESTNKVDEIFGKAADSIFRFSAGTADALGQSNDEARSAAATFGIFGKAAELNDRQAARFSKRMVTLASDLASFNNTEPDQAVEALGAALRGESEPIRAYGVMLDEATLKAEALALGILKPVKDESKIFAYQTRITDLQKSYNEAVAEHGKGSLEALKAEASLGTARTALQKATEGTLPPLTQQQKLLAAQSQIFKQTEVAQGDFARTSDGLANQQRRMAARFEDTKAALGKGLLPIMNDAAGFILEEGIPAFERFADWFNEDGIPALKDAAEFGRDAADNIGDMVRFLKDLPDPAKYAGLAALVTGVAGAKIRGGGRGALGTAGAALGLAKPVPVFVTNPGGLGGGGLPGDPAASGSKWGRAAGGAMALALGITVADSLLPDPKKNRILNPIGDSADRTREWFQDKAGIDRDMPAEPDKWAVEWAGALDASRAKAAGFGSELDLVGSRKINPQITTRGMKPASTMLADFITMQIEAGAAVTPYIRTTSIERALELARALNREMRPHVAEERGVDNSAPYMHGSTGQTRSPRNPRGGMNVERMTVVAHDYDDFVQQSQRRTQQVGLGGFGS